VRAETKSGTGGKHQVRRARDRWILLIKHRYGEGAASTISGAAIYRCQPHWEESTVGRVTSHRPATVADRGCRVVNHCTTFAECIGYDDICRTRQDTRWLARAAGKAR